MHLPAPVRREREPQRAGDDGDFCQRADLGPCREGSQHQTHPEGHGRHPDRLDGPERERNARGLGESGPVRQ